ncbi:MAG: NAD-dependent epimerase/dehydratase [Flavobacteriales bacterium]|nr:NAD-dependent epimerase/dehydratase [Flavobacteriales bacterium]
MRILITGGAGYLGTELTHLLSQDPEVSEIIIYDNLSRKNYNLFLLEKMPGTNIKFVYGDILDSRKLKKVLENVDMVFHLAAKVSTPLANEDPHLFEQVNHWGTAELSYALEESDVSHVVYMSSISVYGARQESVNESSPTSPKTYYGISKLNGEHMLSRLDSKMKIHILRCGNVYGYSKSMRFDAVINKFMFEAHFENRVNIEGSGKQQRAFIHINKVVNVLSRLLNSNEVSSGTYNLVDKNLSVIALANTMKEVYPDMEMIFVQQDLDLKNIIVELNGPFNQEDRSPETDLLTELKEFNNRFAFHPPSIATITETI